MSTSQLATGPGGRRDPAQSCSEMDDLTFLAADGGALLIVPPFADLLSPSFSLHLLQACAEAAGISARVFYSNLSLASVITPEKYQCIVDLAGNIGEMFFADAAFDLPPEPLSRSLLRFDPKERLQKLGESDIDDFVSRLPLLRAEAKEWLDATAASISRCGFKVVGCTTSFEQTCPSVALLKRVKRLNPAIITIIGGANCEGEMAEGIASVCPDIDFVFSGESESSFPEFLRQVSAGQAPPFRIIRGELCRDLDALPIPDYREYFEQRRRFLHESKAPENIHLPAESSRGCWWGQKHHCTFCGLNGSTMAFRTKSPDRVIREIKHLTSSHAVYKVAMTDNIMPYTYFNTVIPRLPAEVPGLDLFYEQKSNLTLKKVIALKKAGVNGIQPGIEALSTSLLSRMDKGVTAAQNLALMRYTASTYIRLAWNLLYAFPGDKLKEYEETLALLPLLFHLHPPTSMGPIIIERFSPYFDHPERYGVSNIRPMEVYSRIFPPGSDIKKLAYNFDGDYASESREHPEIIREMRAVVSAWRESWYSGLKSLTAFSVRRLSPEVFLLIDKRGLPGTKQRQFLNREEASLALVGRRFSPTADIQWALENKLGVEIDGMYVPLCIAEPSLLLEFEDAVNDKQDAPDLPPATIYRISGRAQAV